MRLNIDKTDLDRAVAAQTITQEQSEALWTAWSQKPGPSRAWTVLAYLGALVIISSMTWFATAAFSDANPWILLTTGAVYFALFTAAGVIFRRRLPSEIPAMLMLTVAVFMVPLTVYAFQRLLGVTQWDSPSSYYDFYVWIDKGWFWMEVTTAVTAAVYLAVFRFELLTFPLSFVLWFMSMDLAPALFGRSIDWEERRAVSIVVGLGILLVSYVLDLVRNRRDYSFWLYLFGLMAFWGGISTGWTDQLGLKILYCLLNLGLIAIAVLFRRAVFLVFGSVGVYLFLYDLSTNVFRNSLAFPLYLSLVGAAILVGAIVLLKQQGRIDGYLERVVPAPLKALIPRRWQSGERTQ
jgi:hypothetical protein